MPFLPEDWVSVEKELPDLDFYVLLACIQNDCPFICIGFFLDFDDDMYPQFYSPSHGWVDASHWQYVPLHPVFTDGE